MVRYFKMEPYDTKARSMHRLMSFVGCTGVLTEKSGLVSWLECSFTGIPKMLTINIKIYSVVTVERLC